MKIDLLPLEYRPQPALSIKEILILSGSCTLVFLALLFVGMQFMMLNATKAELNVVKQELKMTEAPMKKVLAAEQRYQQFQKRQTEVTKITNQYQTHLKLLDQIALALSEDLWLNTVKIAQDGMININGSALGFSLIGDYLGRLDKAEALGKAKLKEVNQIEDEGLSYYKFNIDLLNKGGAADAPQPKA